MRGSSRTNLMPAVNSGAEYGCWRQGLTKSCMPATRGSSARTRTWRTSSSTTSMPRPVAVSGLLPDMGSVSRGPTALHAIQPLAYGSAAPFCDAVQRDGIRRTPQTAGVSVCSSARGRPV